MNGIIDFFKGDPGTEDILLNSELSLCDPVVFEFHCGRLSKEVEDSMDSFCKQLPVISTDTKAALRAAKLYKDAKRCGKPTGMLDAMIAGTYLSRGITKIVTRNVKHFKEMTGVEIVEY